MPEVLTFPTAAAAAGALGAGAHVLGGGTLLMRAVNYGDRSVQRIVRTTDPDLTAIRTEGGRTVIGAGVTMSALIAARETDFLAPAARAVGGPAIRNMGTVGGNLFAPHPYGDLTVALLALDAVVRTTTGDVPLEQFLVDRTGLVLAITVARPPGDVLRFRKVARIRPKGAAVLSMAAVLSRSAGRLAGVRVAYGAMAPTPVRVPAVERALEGASLDTDGIAPALAAATEGLDPPDDALASSWYRREVAPVHLRRLLLGED